MSRSAETIAAPWSRVVAWSRVLCDLSVDHGEGRELKIEHLLRVFEAAGDEREAAFAAFAGLCDAHGAYVVFRSDPVPLSEDDDGGAA